MVILKHIWNPSYVHSSGILPIRTERLNNFVNYKEIIDAQDFKSFGISDVNCGTFLLLSCVKCFYDSLLNVAQSSLVT